MGNYFNGQQVELLAPAGNFEIFKEIIHTGADAVYFGGKQFNMRMHRKDFNLTDEEMKEAIRLAHELGKKVYITVNNLYSMDEIEGVKEYLKYLDEIGPDGLIVQDMSIIELINQLELNLVVHSSVMMNVHNLATIKELRDLGVTRIVASREMSLQQIKELSLQTDMEFEYFVHGDMCIAHGSQCTYSGMLFGQSSNRGLCMKPCRWELQIKKDGKVYDTKFPMAVKDMAMYQHIPELLEAGVVSFKIEGRMRDIAYLKGLIEIYRDAIDRYIEDPLCYDRAVHKEAIETNRKRDLSTAYAFGKPGLKNINRRYEGTGKFYSTGKVFSKPTIERETTKERINEVKEVIKTYEGKKEEKMACLAVKVNHYEAAKMAIEEGVPIIYLSGEVYEPHKPFSKEEIKQLTALKGKSKIYLGMPRMMFEPDFKRYIQYLKAQDLGIDGVLTTNLGAITTYKNEGLELIGDFSLNIYNTLAANFYKKAGLTRGTLSLETPLENMLKVVSESALPLEIVVHGAPAVMYMEHDLYENIDVLEGTSIDGDSGKEGILYLLDDKGQEHPVYRDNQGRNHMLLTKELSYLPFIKELQAMGAGYFRIEGCHYETEALREVIRAYKAVLNGEKDGLEMQESLKYNNNGYTLGAIQFN